MLVQTKKTTAIGIALGLALMGGSAAQASAQATQDTSNAPTQDTSAYSAPERSDTSAPVGAVDSTNPGTDSTGLSKMGADSVTTGADSVTTGADSAKTSGDSKWTDTSKSVKKDDMESGDSAK